MSGWLRPVVRSVRWLPLGVAPAAGVGALALARAGSAVPPGPAVTAVVVGVVIAAATYALGDPAGELLEPLPTGAPRRVARRALVTAAPTGLAVAAVLTTGRALYGAVWSAPGALAVAVLGLGGGAVAVTAHRHPDAPAVAMVAWVLGGVALLGLGAPRELAFPWWP